MPPLTARKDKPLGFLKHSFSGSNLLRHHIGRAITTAQETIGFVIPNDLFLRGVEVQRALQTVRGIGEMHERR